MPEAERAHAAKAFREEVRRIKEFVIVRYEKSLRRTSEPKIETRLDRLESPPKQIRLSAAARGC